MGAGAAAYNEKTETDTFRENYSWKIPITHNDFKILKNNESQLNEVLRLKFNCVSTLVSLTLEGNRKSLQVYRKMLSPGLELSVWKDDLTRHAVDAVVNAANEDLLHGGGLALALVKAGGPKIQEESRKFVAQYGRISAGNIGVTGAGMLPCKMIIHAVGPRWLSTEHQRCISELQCAIMNVLNYVIFGNVSIETVAIPALSSGIFQFPLNLCTRVIVETIWSYFQERQGVSKLKEIHLVSNEDPTVAAFKDASELLLGPTEQVLQMSREAIPPSNMIVINNLTLQVLQDHIEWQKTDMIVNSVSPYSLRIGPVSKSILQHAGPEMEWEFEQKTKWLHDSPPVVVTKGYKLSCQYICHVIWHTSYAPDQILKNAVGECLKKCIELNKTSISFPALGTGNINMRKDKAVEIMFEEVLKFAKDCAEKKLIVNFVIFPEEIETYKVFIAEMEKAKKWSLSNYSVLPSREERGENGFEASSSVINLMGYKNEEMCEAKLWIERLLTLRDHHIIENNHILYLGGKEHDMLSQLQKTSSVSISEIISPGKAYLEIKGAQADLIEVVLNIEQMLCEVQEEVARKKERGLWSLSGQCTDKNEMKESITFKKYPVPSTQKLQDQKKQFEKCGLHVMKVEKIDNAVLMAAFQRKKKMMEEQSHRAPVSCRLFQQVPHQFCNGICKVGFQRIYSVPCDPKYGAGIYFTKNLKNLADKVKKTSTTDRLIYVFEAEVLTGSFCQGQQSNIVPPPLNPGAIENHDSVVDSVSNPETFVIFNSTQAIPQYLWICTQGDSQDYSSGPIALSSQSPWGPKLSSGSSVD